MSDTWTPLPADRLSQAVEEADLRVLLMVIFHLTGDRRWLSDPYLPKRDVNLIADEDAGLSKEARAEVQAKAVELLSSPDLAPAVDDPGDELMVEMMSRCLGEAVPPEYALMMREEMGLCSRQVDWRDEKPTDVRDHLPVVIVGAGASGIALAANLEKLGVSFTILEKNDEVGGTWYENTYPGCGVDTPNHAYSFSFGTRYRWSRYFAPRDELQDYLVRSAEEAGIRAKTRFATRVVKTDWDEVACCWRVLAEGPDGSEEIQAMAVVSAIGQLSLPSVPHIEVADTFDGPIFHTAEWPDGLELAGKRVAIIGTGASSMQIVPTVVDEVASFTVYQRNAQWARPIPRYHDPIGDGAQWLLEKVPYYAAWFRFTMLWRYGDGLLPTLKKDPNWEHPERSLNRANDRHRIQMTEHMEEELAGRPDLLAKCLPTYPPYGKRILLDNGWFAAITKPNVELVTDDIVRIDPSGVVTTDGQLREADIVVLATGFKVSLMTARLNVTGREGRKLTDVWADDNPSAHLGITVPGFPNLFTMQGPNSGLGHGGSAIFQAECQARYIAGCLARMIEDGIDAIDVQQDVHDEYVRRVDAEHEGMIWTHPGMSTYYRNAKGRVVSVMPWRLVDYWSMTHEPDFSEFLVLKTG
ncbi:MAG: NAD(P)/FAD-dependent oxidoreductase [Alphaproteobacteria bacterium]|nr:NAD(P)/FAD-dependent oxidoreductase [Alphaproteobacteria bacterium]